LKAFIAHPSALPAAALKTVAPERCAGVDLVITSYGSLLPRPWIAGNHLAACRPGRGRRPFKNPEAKQTRTVKKLEVGCYAWR